jgi:hypothetical protein
MMNTSLKAAMFCAAQDLKTILTHGLGHWPMADGEASQVEKVCVCQNAKRRDSPKDFPHRCGFMLGRVGHMTSIVAGRKTFHLREYATIFRPGLYTVPINFFTYLTDEHWYELFGRDEHYVWVRNPWYREPASVTEAWVNAA